MENQTPQNQEQGLSVDHVKQLEEFLGTLMTNQEIIISQNKEMLSANKTKQMWGIAKFIFFILITFGSIFYMPQLISKMTEQVSSNMNIDLGGLNIKADSSGNTISPNTVMDLKEQLEFLRSQ
jgi:hypothetical protein